MGHKAKKVKLQVWMPTSQNPFSVDVCHAINPWEKSGIALTRNDLYAIRAALLHAVCYEAK